MDANAYTTLTEEITFNKDGSSRHILKAADGTVLADQTHNPSPILFVPRWPSTTDLGIIKTAKELGITQTTRMVEARFDDLDIAPKPR